MKQRPLCDFCKEQPADIFKEEQGKKIYHCASCYVKQNNLNKNGTNNRPRD